MEGCNLAFFRGVMTDTPDRVRGSLTRTRASILAFHNISTLIALSANNSCICPLSCGELETRLRIVMPHYVAIVEDAGPEKAVGIWFPDLPGCFSAGEDVDEALRNAHEALALYAESQALEGRRLPTPRTISALKNDPEVAAEIREHVVALIALPTEAAHAAE
jgi:predicted RNase H-like HicB family nuclease